MSRILFPRRANPARRSARGPRRVIGRRRYRPGSSPKWALWSKAAPAWRWAKSLRQGVAAAQSRFSGLMASASAWLGPQVETTAREEAPVEAAEPVRARRAQARKTLENGGEPVQQPPQDRPQPRKPGSEPRGTGPRKIDLEVSRREIEAVQARLDARAAPRDPDEKWAADLAREYRREFHPIEAGRAAPAVPSEPGKPRRPRMARRRRFFLLAKRRGGPAWSLSP